MFRTRAAAEVAIRAAAGRMRPEDLPTGTRIADVLELPPPFTTWFSMTSDCDSPKEHRYLDVGAIVREQLGLPIADSYFPDWLFRRGQQRVSAEETQRSGRVLAIDHDRFLEQNAAWLRAFHRGWFDVVHGWIQRLMVMITPDFVLTASARRHRAEFNAPVGWQQAQAPRYLALRLRMPLNTCSFRLIGVHGAAELFTIDSGAQRIAASQLGFGDYVLDLWPLVGTDPERLRAIAIEFELGGPEDAVLEVRDACLLSCIRADIIEQRDWLERFNVGSSVFTSHGIGVLLGVRGMSETPSTDPRCLADLPANPHYCIDVLEEHGITAFNTFSNTCVMEPRHIDELVSVYTLPDGHPVYDFDRYAHVPKKRDGSYDYEHYSFGGQLVNYSYADCIGRHVAGLMHEIDGRSGCGGLLYTHSIVSAERIDVPDAPGAYAFNDETMTALATIADRHWNLTGEVAADRRVFVAPTSVLVRLSQVRREVVHRAVYDPARNEVALASWVDPVTRRRVPSADAAWRELRHIPFVVDDASDARLSIDGVDVPCLIRCSADRSGRESIAVADTSAPRALLGEVPVERACTRRDVDVEHRSGGGHRVSLRARTGAMRVAATAPALIDYSTLGAALSCSHERLQWRASLELEDGRRISMCSRGWRDSTGALVLARASGSEPRVVVCPTWDLVGAMAQPRHAAMTTPLVALSIEFDGEPGDACTLAWVRLFRDDENPVRAGGCLVGGRVGARRGVERVVMVDAEREYVARPTAAGLYFFAHRVRAGSVVAIEAVTVDGERLAPRGGRAVEVLANLVDVDF